MNPNTTFSYVSYTKDNLLAMYKYNEMTQIRI